MLPLRGLCVLCGGAFRQCGRAARTPRHETAIRNILPTMNQNKNRNPAATMAVRMSNQAYYRQVSRDETLSDTSVLDRSSCSSGANAPASAALLSRKRADSLCDRHRRSACDIVRARTLGKGSPGIPWTLSLIHI